MTRAEIKRNVLLRLAETPDQGREPLFLDEAVKMAANEVAQRTDCYQTYYAMAIDGSPTALQEFCLPGELYKIESAKVINTDDTIEILNRQRRQIVTRAWMDKHIPRWLSTPYDTGDVRLLVLNLPKAILWPFPAYDKAAGLTLYGYATPGDAWTASAAAEADECPLPAYSHTSVELRAAIIRATQFPTKENLTRLPMLERDYERAVGLVAIHSRQQNADASLYTGGMI